jgi:hypothetical protein
MSVSAWLTATELKKVSETLRHLREQVDGDGRKLSLADIDQIREALALLNTEHNKLCEKIKGWVQAGPGGGNDGQSAKM